MRVHNYIWITFGLQLNLTIPSATYKHRIELKCINNPLIVFAWSRQAFNMNKKQRTGPRIRVTRTRSHKPDEFDDKKFVYSCPYCRLKFSQNIEYFKHMSTNHEIQQKAATYECNDCQIVFTKKSSLDLHCKTNHKVRNNLKCSSCSITFKSRYCLRRHMKLKEILAENSCLKCTKKFQNQDGLLKHVNNKHTDKNTIFQCNLCSLKFKVEASLTSHLNRIHKRLWL